MEVIMKRILFVGLLLFLSTGLNAMGLPYGFDGCDDAAEFQASICFALLKRSDKRVDRVTRASEELLEGHFAYCKQSCDRQAYCALEATSPLIDAIKANDPIAVSEAFANGATVDDDSIGYITSNPEQMDIGIVSAIAIHRSCKTSHLRTSARHIQRSLQID